MNVFPSARNLLQDTRNYGPVVFVAPDFQRYVSVNGSYLLIWEWDDKHGRFDNVDAQSRDSGESNYRLTLDAIDQWAREFYAQYMESKGITIDPSML